MADENKFTTTDAGIPVASDEHSLAIGADGPIVLHDHYLLEQMAFRIMGSDHGVEPAVSK